MKLAGNFIFAKIWSKKIVYFIGKLIDFGAENANNLV
jgi:hypothetical protein